MEDAVIARDEAEARMPDELKLDILLPRDPVNRRALALKAVSATEDCRC